MTSVQIDDRAIQRKLDDLIRKGGDASSAMRRIAGALRRAVDNAFADEKDPVSGQAWQELSEVTKGRRRKGKAKRKTLEILKDSGTLAGSSNADSGRDYAVAGTNVPYAATHQFGAAKGQYGQTQRGAPIPWGDIPARPFLGIGPDDKKEIIDILKQEMGINR